MHINGSHDQSIHINYLSTSISMDCVRKQFPQETPVCGATVGVKIVIDCTHTLCIMW